MRLTDIAHDWLKSSLNAGDIAIDATLGNGHDALFLAQQLGEHGQLFGFDVQQQAIDQTQHHLALTPCNKIFYCTGHQHLDASIPLEHKGKVNAIMFNLGWLPNSDKNIITQAATTIAALEQSIAWLAVGGKISIMVYPGHAGGDTEAAQVITWVEQACSHAPQSLGMEKVEVPNKPSAPMLIKLEKYSLQSRCL